jgi:hypothetical protein
MLTNTVGIMLMILIFTVLATGGALVAKRLPMEQDTKSRPLVFLCEPDGRLRPVNDELTKRFTDKLESPTVFTIDSWLATFRNRRVEDDYFVAAGQAELIGGSLLAAMRLEPKPMRGDTSDDLSRGSAQFLTVLAANDPGKRFAFFVVKPECMHVFTQARDLAAARAFPTGWMPVATDQPLLLSLSGAGYEPKVSSGR